MDERALRRVADRLAELDKLEHRRDAILAALEKSGDLNPALARAVAAADTPTRLEDLYLPHRPKRATRASAALDLGLGPLADDLLDPSTPYSRGFIRRFVEAPGVADADAAMRGARDIVAEKAGECVEAREAARRACWRTGRLTAKEVPEPKPATAKAKAKAAGDDGRGRRGGCERGGGGGEISGSSARRRSRLPLLRTGCSTDPAAPVPRAVPRGDRGGGSRERRVGRHPRGRRREPRALLRKGLRGEKAAEVEVAVKDGVKRLLRPAAERETRARLRDDAIRRAVRDFGANVAALILAPPMRPAAPVVGLDPAHRTGCKIAAVSATGAVLAAAVAPAPAAGGFGRGRRREGRQEVPGVLREARRARGGGRGRRGDAGG